MFFLRIMGLHEFISRPLGGPYIKLIVFFNGFFNLSRWIIGWSYESVSFYLILYSFLPVSFLPSLLPFLLSFLLSFFPSFNSFDAAFQNLEHTFQKTNFKTYKAFSWFSCWRQTKYCFHRQDLYSKRKKTYVAQSQEAFLIRIFLIKFSLYLPSPIYHGQ